MERIEEVDHESGSEAIVNDKAMSAFIQRDASADKLKKRPAGVEELLKQVGARKVLAPEGVGGSKQSLFTRFMPWRKGKVIPSRICEHNRVRSDCEQCSAPKLSRTPPTLLYFARLLSGATYKGAERPKPRDKLHPLGFKIHPGIMQELAQQAANDASGPGTRPRARAWEVDEPDLNYVFPANPNDIVSPFAGPVVRRRIEEDMHEKEPMWPGATSNSRWAQEPSRLRALFLQLHETEKAMRVTIREVEEQKEKTRMDALEAKRSQEQAERKRIEQMREDAQRDAELEREKQDKVQAVHVDAWKLRKQVREGTLKAIEKGTLKASDTGMAAGKAVKVNSALVVSSDSSIQRTRKRR